MIGHFSDLQVREVTYFSVTRRFSNSNSSFLDEREAFSLIVTRHVTLTEP